MLSISEKVYMFTTTVILAQQIIFVLVLLFVYEIITA